RSWYSCAGCWYGLSRPSERGSPVWLPPQAWALKLQVYWVPGWNSSSAPLQPLIPQTREPPKTTTLEPGFCFLRSNSSSSLLRKSPYSEIKKALYSRQCIRRSLAPTASALPPSVSGLYPGIHLLVMGVQGKQPEPGVTTEAAS